MVAYTKSFFEFLQKIGKATMLPVSILPVAGILLGVGGALLSGVSRGAIQIQSETLILIFQIMKNAGEPIFSNLPLIFAIGVALGLTENDGAASIAAIVGYVVLQGTMGVVAPHVGLEVKTIMGIASIETGVFGGILVGVIAAWLFNRYYKIELPSYLGFFGGRRFVPIVTSFACILLGVALCFIWPPIQKGINHFSHFAVTSQPAFAVFLYGIVERTLLPFGLHHIWNVPFFFQIGDFTTASGEVVHGELTRFFAGDPTAGNLGGGYLFKMWGLPAAALAMWQTAKPEHKTRIGSIMISAALTSFLTGITEPIEFSFLFVAPLLYAVHALFAGLCFPLMYVLNVKLGYTFSHGFIDYALFYIMGTKPWMVMVVGPLVGVIYYWAFKIIILKFNIKTPGREDTSAASAMSADRSERGRQLVMACGGKENIKSLDSCITRIRIGLVDSKKANSEEFKRLGASGVMAIGNNLQVIFGPSSENLKNEMQSFMGPPMTTTTVTPVAAPAVAESSFQASPEIIRALGGSANIKELKPMATTRLRVTLDKDDQINSPALKTAGVAGVMKISKGVFHLVLKR